MRQAINENRTVQLVLIGVLLLAGGMFLLMSKGGGGESAESAPVESTTAPDAATAVPSTASDPSTLASTGAVPASTGTVATVPADLVPGPSLPPGFLSAYRDGDAIVLLVRRAGGIDDALVRESTERLRALPGVEVFVTRAKDIARFAWLTQGVEVTDLPALVVLRPRKLSGGKPTAYASYGFRGAGSVVQAVEDQLYRGPTDRPFHP